MSLRTFGKILPVRMIGMSLSNDVAKEGYILLVKSKLRMKYLYCALLGPGVW